MWVIRMEKKVHNHGVFSNKYLDIEYEMVREKTMIDHGIEMGEMFLPLMKIR